MRRSQSACIQSSSPRALRHNTESQRFDLPGTTFSVKSVWEVGDMKL